MEKKFDISDAETVAPAIGIEWQTVRFTPKDLAQGMNVELEHGKRDSQTNVTDDDPISTAKIALAHLKESYLYYRDLEILEECEKKLGKIKCKSKSSKSKTPKSKSSKSKSK